MRWIRAGEEGRGWEKFTLEGTPLDPPLFISKDQAVFVWKEIEKYNAVQPHHYSMPRSRFASARCALAVLSIYAMFVTQKREFAI